MPVRSSRQKVPEEGSIKIYEKKSINLKKKKERKKNKIVPSSHPCRGFFQRSFGNTGRSRVSLSLSLSVNKIDFSRAFSRLRASRSMLTERRRSKKCTVYPPPRFLSLPAFRPIVKRRWSGKTLASKTFDAEETRAASYKVASTS